MLDLRQYCCHAFFFFFQAEDGIRDLTVTGVQTCALPIYTLAVVAGKVVPSVKAVKFYYYYDVNGNGQADDGNSWILAADATLKTGSLNTWVASWNATSLAQSQYLIGLQAVDDNTQGDDGVTPAGVDHRT